MEQTTHTPWYNRKWLVILLCIFFFPVGLYALWKGNVFGTAAKMGITVVIGILVIGNVAARMQEQSGGGNSYNTSHTDVSVTTQPAISIDAPTLIQEYQDNEVKADNAYKGQRIRVTGKVGDIGKDIMDDIYVTLKSNSQYSISSVQCFISDANVAANLKKGQQITVEGDCEGLMMNVLIQNAQVILP
jgi:hypothetical protein